MQILEKLTNGDPETWNEAFQYLYPVAFEAARTKLGEDFKECEDVAMEALSEFLERGAQINSERELKSLIAAIARNKATDRVRRYFAEKRGGNKVQSLDAILETNANDIPIVAQDEFVDQLAVLELRDLLTDLSAKVKKEYRVVLRDHFFDQLSYKEIAKRRKISVGSVGVYVQRGLASLKNVIARKPKLQREFLNILSDVSVVRVLLPLVSALQLGGWFCSHLFNSPAIRSNIGSIEDELSDENQLQIAHEELPKSQLLTESKRALLLEKLKL